VASRAYCDLLLCGVCQLYWWLRCVSLCAIAALLRKKLRSFRVWCTLVQHQRDVELSKEQARLLVYAKDQRTVREHELESLLEMERERSAAAVSNHSSLIRALETAEGRVTELSEALSAVVTADTSSGKGGGAQDDLYEQLQREKERVVVLTAKFNTLKARADQPEAPLPAVVPFRPSRYTACVMLSSYVNSVAQRMSCSSVQSCREGVYLRAHLWRWSLPSDICLRHATTETAR
jgi:hypothetical protein